MLLQKRKLGFPLVAAFAGTLFGALAAAPSAHAGLSQVAVGFGLPVPQGDNYQLLSRHTSYQAEAWYGQDLFGGQVTFHGEVLYQPYDVKNVGSTTLNVTSGYVGVSLEGTPVFLNLTPFLNADVGLAYDSLSISGTSNNSATAFALQLEPGVDLSIWSGLGIKYEMPISNAFFKNNSLTTWSNVFALRWKL